MIALNWDPTPRQLRQFALVWLLLVGALGAIVFTRGRVGGVATALLVLVLAPGPMGLLWPGSVRLVYVALSAAVWPLAQVVSTLVLLILYYGVLTPTGLAMRLLAHEPLALRRAPPSVSYWKPRKAPGGPESYLRQS